MRIIVLTGAGVSAESGLKTFRDENGLWEGHDVMEVASPQGWANNPELVLNFYNERRKQALHAQPNRAHELIASLEKAHQVQVITQNVDNLHEKAGSTQVLHLHGELFQSRSTVDESLTYEMEGWQLQIGDKCEKGSQLRPNIVWFGEAVPLMEEAIRFTEKADIFLVVGTSLQVYPAAGLVHYAPQNAPIYVIDPKKPDFKEPDRFHFIQKKATVGMDEVLKLF